MLLKLNPEQGSNSLQFYKVERGEGAAEGKSKARRSWFMRFQESCHFKKVLIEAESADTEASNELSRRAKIKQGDYQFFYVFFWKKTPPRTFIVTEEKSMLDFKKPN